MPNGKLLDGWREIAAAIAATAGVTQSVAKAKRLEVRGLPVRRVGNMLNPKRVVAGAVAVTDWARRKFATLTEK